MKLLVVAILVVAVAAAAPPSNVQKQMKNLYKDPLVPIGDVPDARIIGGTEVAPHSIPYQAFLEVFEAFGGWYCGGSLISRSYILTAGHCAEGANDAEVTLGAHRPQSPEASQLKVRGVKFIIHPQFDLDRIINDISLIQLEEPVRLSSAIALVPLPASVHDLYVGRTGQVSGWGLTVGTAQDISPVLRSTSNPILSNGACENEFGLGPLPDTQICLSGTGGHSSCNGDSGGPLTVDGVQVGVVSYGLRRCPPGYPSAYTRVTKFKAWILENSDLE